MFNIMQYIVEQFIIRLRTDMSNTFFAITRECPIVNNVFRPVPSILIAAAT